MSSEPTVIPFELTNKKTLYLEHAHWALLDLFWRHQASSGHTKTRIGIALLSAGLVALHKEGYPELTANGLHGHHKLRSDNEWLNSGQPLHAGNIQGQVPYPPDDDGETLCIWKIQHPGQLI